MEKISFTLSIVLNSIIIICCSVATICGVVSATKCITKEDYHGMIKGLLMTLLGIAIINGYPTMAEAVRNLLR